MAVGIDSFAVTFLAKELKGIITGHAIGSISLKDDKVLLFHLDGRPPLNLVFMAESTLPLLCASERLGRGEDLPHPPRLEEPLKGCVITDVAQIGLDRILMLTLGSVSGRVLRLYFEMVQPFPNMFLTDGEDVILEPLFKAGTRTRRRVLDRGATYSVPPPPDRVHPADITAEVIDAIDWRTDPAALSKRITGVSPFLSRELAARAGGTGSIYEVFRQMLDDYRKAHASPCVFEADPSISKNPPHIGLAWFRPVMEGVRGIRPERTLTRCAESVMTTFLAVGSLEGKRASVLRALSKETRKWEKVRARAAEALAERGEADRLRRFGEIVVANMGRIRRGSREARLPDIYSPDQREVAIPLEPRLTAQANADVYFKRAKKTLRRADRAAEQLETAEARLRTLAGLTDEATAAQTPEQRLEEIAQLLSRELVVKKATRGPVDEKAERLGIRPRRYEVAGGWTVLVGRSAKENDVLSHRYAAPSDLWFHARQAQGSHVVLRRPKKKTQVPKEAIIQAAAIAAYYSKARGSRHVPVSYTEKRYVKKVRRGAAGTAAMLREKVIFVTPGLPA